jgi:hypothetical protein
MMRTADSTTDSTPCENCETLQPTFLSTQRCQTSKKRATSSAIYRTPPLSCYVKPPKHNTATATRHCHKEQYSRLRFSTAVYFSQARRSEPYRRRSRARRALGPHPRARSVDPFRRRRSRAHPHRHRVVLRASTHRRCAAHRARRERRIPPRTKVRVHDHNGLRLQIIQTRPTHHRLTRRRRVDRLGLARNGHTALRLRRLLRSACRPLI